MSPAAEADAEHVPGLFPVPGDGVLARRGNLILLCSLEDNQTADTLLDLLDQIAAGRGDGRQFTDEVAAALESDEGMPSVLAFGPAGAGVAVTVSGGAWADLRTADGSVRVEAGHPRMLLRCSLRAPVAGITGGLSPADNGVASTDRFSRLDAGTVRAGGLSFYQGDITGLEGAAGGEAVRFGKGRGPAAAQTPAAEARLAGVPVAHVPEVDAGGPGPQAGPAAPAAPGETVPPAASAEAGIVGVGQPTAAWVAPDVPVPAAEPAPAAAEAAQAAAEPAPAGPPPAAPPEPAAGPGGGGQRQPTELWVPPPGGTPGDLERDVTEPPTPYEPAQPFEAVLLFGADQGGGVDVPARSPLSKVKDLPVGTSSYVSAGPIINGVYCKNGHFDDPEALFCAICGISMNQQTLVPRPGERPPLGVLLLDDGSVFQLDSDYVAGREPSLDSAVAAGKARPLRVTDDNGIVSRVHARIHLDGWRVLVTDLGSANGTRVQLPGQGGDHQLVPQVPIVLATGSQVDLGGRGFRYESHRGR